MSEIPKLSGENIQIAITSDVESFLRTFKGFSLPVAFKGTFEEISDHCSINHLEQPKVVPKEIVFDTGASTVVWLKQIDDIGEF